MQLILYAILISMFVFVIQLFLIIIKYSKSKNKDKENLKLTLRLVGAFIISIIIGIISFYILGMYTLSGLNEGR